MDCKDIQTNTCSPIERDTDLYNLLTATDAEKEYSTVSYDKKEELVDSKHVDITLKTKHIRNAQSNIGGNDNTASSNNPTSFTNVSKFSLIVVIVAMVVFMVVITIVSSTVTAVILRQELANDLQSIKEDVASLNLNKDKDEESVWFTWSAWGVCSVTCNGGIRTRHRACDTSGTERSRVTCKVNDLDVSMCTNDFCAESVWSTWSEWRECSVTCNGGIRPRNRTCDTSGIDGSRGTCIGNNVDISTCHIELCAGM